MESIKEPPEQYTLALGDVIVGLRKLDDGTFAPKNSKIFNSVLIKNEKSYLTDRFRVCLSTANREEDILNILNDIEEKMEGKKWIFFAADYSKGDEAFEKIKQHTTSAGSFFPIKLKHCKDELSAEKAIGKISDIYEEEYPYKLNFRKENSSKIDHKIQSFCFVATKEVKEEAAILIKSLRGFHSEPIYIVCDKETEHFLSCMNADLSDVFFRLEMEQKVLDAIDKKYNFERKNNYHRPECIIKKMDCMSYALENHDNVFFLDSDMIVLDSLQEKFDKDIFLSPHYHKTGTPDSNNSIDYGFFNAGYVFCANSDLPNFWKDTYINDSDFFEQECMNQICEKFDVGFFSNRHNVGFWRKNFNAKIEPKSIHVHAVDNKNLQRNARLKSENNKLKSKTIKLLRSSENENHHEILEFINKIDSGWGGKQENFNFQASNPEGKINLGLQTVFDSHRSGWKYAVSALAPLHNNNGVLLDGFLENNFAWHLEEYRREKKVIPYKTPWVGFFHNPQNMPPWFFNKYSLQNIIAGGEFQESLEHCVGLFTLSEYHAEYLRETTGKTVCSLIHPTEIPETLFDYDKFLKNKNKQIVNIGYWLRKLNSIYSIPIASGNEYTKLRLIPYSSATPLEVISEMLEKEKVIYDIQIEQKYIDNTTTKSSLSNEDYDALLSENIVFLDLYDSSANNAVIECIARATPLLVNPLPAVTEYLGEDYPLYYNSLEECAEKAEDLGLIKEAHGYLKDCEIRKKLSQEHFRKSFEKSEVYDLLK
jgi:hypothetical protein